MSKYGESLGLKEFREGYAIHHIVPRWLGGPNMPFNYYLVNQKDHSEIHAGDLKKLYRFAKENS